MSIVRLRTASAFLSVPLLLVACSTAPTDSQLDAGLFDGFAGDALAPLDSGQPPDLAGPPADAGTCQSETACDAIACFPAATCGALDAVEYGQPNTYTPCGVVTSFASAYAMEDCADPSHSSSFGTAMPDCGLAQVSGTMQVYCSAGASVVRVAVRIALDAILPPTSAAGTTLTIYSLDGYGLDEGGAASSSSGWIHFAKPVSATQTLVSAVSFQNLSFSPSQTRLLFLATKEVDPGGGPNVKTQYVVASLSLRLDPAVLMSGGAIELQ